MCMYVRTKEFVGWNENPYGMDQKALNVKHYFGVSWSKNLISWNKIYSKCVISWNKFTPNV